MTNEDTARRATTLMADARKYGTTIPKPILAAEQVTASALESLRAAEAASSDQALIPAVTEALEAGADPLAAPAVLQAVAARAITGSANYPMVKASAVGPLARALQQHGPELVKALRPRFDKAAAVLAEARQHLGGVDLDNAPAVLSLGGNAAEAHRAVLEAEKTIRAAANLLRQHNEITALRVNGDLQMLRWADPSHEQWRALSKARPYVVAGAGIALHLPTPDELRDRLARLEADAAEAVRQSVGPAAGGIAVRTY